MIYLSTDRTITKGRIQTVRAGAREIERRDKGGTDQARTARGNGEQQQCVWNSETKGKCQRES